MSASEISANVLLRVAPLLVRYDNTAVLSERRKPAGHRLVIAEKTVAVELNEIGKGQLQVVKGKGPGGMPGDLHSLPGSERLIDLTPGLLDFLLHCLDFAFEIDGLQFGVLLEFLELLFEVRNRLFKIHRFHSTTTGVSRPTRANNSSISSGANLMPVFGGWTFGV